ncbi:hypothetical protein J1N35_014826 [Gossypium stocksii]|uniref:Uncharacterized protein n=1 Tax=Gossypium stocksii TaxID=47602 RepID=A0A9D3VVS2_9ROSI|nr:hypothetical protein J1N35_014826 [Gossypium stocksii]
MVVCYYNNHGRGTDCHFYVIEWTTLIHSTYDKFEWMAYFDLRIQECISSEFLVNLNI